MGIFPIFWETKGCFAIVASNLNDFNNPFNIRHLARLEVEMSKDGMGKRRLGKAKFLFHSMVFSLEDNLRAIDHGREESTACSGARGTFHRATKMQVWLLFEQSLASY